MLSLIVIVVLGLIFGSFISAISWRIPRDEKFTTGRSVCDKCGKKIEWHDNIPVLSYLILQGKCRNCNSKISIRYPLIEISTSLVFLIVAYVYQQCSSILVFDSTICVWRDVLGLYALPYLLAVSTILIIIFVIDFEHKIIPDPLVVLLFVLSVLLLITTNFYIWEYLFSGFIAGLFLLFLHIITYGKGMGLGDVKLAIPLGVFLGLKLTISWMFLSFLIGALVGVVLIGLKKAKWGKQIPFGPFLVISFFLTLMIGGLIENFLFFY